MGKLYLSFGDSCFGANDKKILYGTLFLLSLQSIGMEGKRIKSRFYKLVMANSDPVISYNIRINVSFILEKFRFY